MFEKETILQFMQELPTQAISEKDLMKRLHVESDERHDFKRLLRELVAGGALVESSKHKYALPEKLGLMVGHVHSNRKGFAFVVSRQPGTPDIYVGHDNLGNAFHGDLVVVRLLHKKNGPSDEGQIVEVLQRGQNRIVGHYEARGEQGFVIPEDTKLPFKIHVTAENTGRAQDRQIVVAQILNFETRNPEGTIVEVLGYPQTPGIDEQIVIHSFNLPTEFPAAALQAADGFPEEISPEEIAQRLDLRETCLFTIDGEHARDFDDAVSLERLENANYKLGVHIADVNYYVREGDPLDQEAYQRGTSVYFPERAIPMFPERLSNNLCSLREGEDRLCMTVFMEFEPTMKMVAYDIKPSVIRSTARLTYTAVSRMLKERDETLRAQYKDLLPTLELMKELSELLLQKRMQRGSLDFDLPEPEIVLDMLGNVENIFKAERNLAHRIIEEFMIAANETVATHLSWLQTPSLYRSHDKPDEGRIATLNAFLHSLGLGLRPGAELHPKDIQRLIKTVHGKPTEHLVNFVTLRAMKQARYTTENGGHFGLASKCYTHFTSPIRRYPDLIVHRILKETLQGRGFSEDAQEQRQQHLSGVAQHSSLRERNATDAERDILQVKKLRFMEDKLGDIFDGVISGVAAFGVFVELREFFVEGLIHITHLHDDYYHYHEESYSLVGERTHKRYRVGDSVRVQVANVDVAKRQIDFLLTSQNA